MNPDTIADEMRWARDDFHRLVDGATSADLRQQSDGTKWTNEQLLFHMLFGYLVVRNLQPIVRTFARLPHRWSGGFAGALNAATGPFDVVNYVGSLGGARVLGHARMELLMDRVVDSLMASLQATDASRLQGGMHFPVDWDPYFHDFMTIQDVYHFATQHYLHHRGQLTLSNVTE